MCVYLWWPASHDINRLLYGCPGPPILRGLNSQTITEGGLARRSRQARDRLLVRRPTILSLGPYPVVARVFICR
jgi:hypothetical protein